MAEKQKKTADLAVNIIIVLSVFLAVAAYFNGKQDILGSRNVQCFKYFTTDSNILAALGSGLWLIYALRPSGKIPKWVVVFKFVGTVAVSITLLTVVFFLAPVGALRGKGWTTAMWYFKGNVFVLHLSAPVLSIVSTLFLERGERITKLQALLSILPVVIYSVVYLIMVVFLQQWTDWYGFTFGGRYGLAPVVMIVMYAFSAGLSLLERAIKVR